nr:splicing factor 3A subunit [Cryptomonas sp.]
MFFFLSNKIVYVKFEQNMNKPKKINIDKSFFFILRSKFNSIKYEQKIRYSIEKQFVILVKNLFYQNKRKLFIYSGCQYQTKKNSCKIQYLNFYKKPSKNKSKTSKYTETFWNELFYINKTDKVQVIKFFRMNTLRKLLNYRKKEFIINSVYLFGFSYTVEKFFTYAKNNFHWIFIKYIFLNFNILCLRLINFGFYEYIRYDQNFEFSILNSLSKFLKLMKKDYNYLYNLENIKNERKNNVSNNVDCFLFLYNSMFPKKGHIGNRINNRIVSILYHKIKFSQIIQKKGTFGNFSHFITYLLELDHFIRNKGVYIRFIPDQLRTFNGKNVPRWILRKCKLNEEYKCELCVNYIYRGTESFNNHFYDKMHINKLLYIGIKPGTENYYIGVSKISHVFRMMEIVNTRTLDNQGYKQVY